MGDTGDELPTVRTTGAPRWAPADDLERVMDLAQLAPWELDLETETFAFNDRFYALCGTTAEREGGYRMTAATYAREFLPPEEAHLVGEQIARYRTIRQPGVEWQLEHRLRRRDGEVRHVLVRIAVVLDAAGHPRTGRGVNQDVTERRRMEVALRESEEKFSKAFLDSPVAMAIRDLTSGRYVDVNEECLRMTGYGRAEIIGRTPAEIGWIADADRGDFETWLKKEAVHENELQLTRRDGQGIVCSYSSHIVSIGGRPSLLSIARDITEQKRAEQERAEMSRALGRKNRELETLVYVTSHDLRSPLLNIQGFSQRIAEGCAELHRLAALDTLTAAERESLVAITTQRMPKAVGHILSSVEKMDRLIGGLVRLSRLGRATLTPVAIDLRAMLDEIVAAMAFPLEAARADVEVGPLPPCRGDAGLINQLFTNLLDNALKYREPSRPLRIVVSGRIENGKAVYRVADNGVGITPENREKIWELFYRVNPRGPVGGEGLGLNLVQRIVERHRGEIGVESTPGAGSCFVIKLPPAQRRPTGEGGRA